MTFDISLEAIEADLALADRDPGGRLSNLALAKAQIRATLLASQTASGKQIEFSIDQGSYPTVEQLTERMAAIMRSPVYPSTEDQADAAADVAGIIIDGPTDPEVIMDPDEDDDFFAEARRERD